VTALGSGWSSGEPDIYVCIYTYIYIHIGGVKCDGLGFMLEFR